LSCQSRKLRNLNISSTRKTYRELKNYECQDCLHWSTIFFPSNMIISTRRNIACPSKIACPIMNLMQDSPRPRVNRETMREHTYNHWVYNSNLSCHWKGITSPLRHDIANFVRQVLKINSLWFAQKMGTPR
jgi:hypothetical protein